MAEMDVDPKHHRHFVSRRAEVLREIKAQFGGVDVSFPRSGSDSHTVSLKGAKDCVDAAKQRIQEIVDALVSVGGGGGEEVGYGGLLWGWVVEGAGKWGRA